MDCHFNDQCLSHIETSELICSANQLTGLYMRETLVVKGLIIVIVPCQFLFHISSTELFCVKVT